MCKHENAKDWTTDRHSKNPIEHIYCPECGWHKFRGVEYTATEWDLYVNDEPAIIPEELQEEYSDWVRNLPDTFNPRVSIGQSNAIYYRHKYRMLKYLSKKYNIRLQRLEQYYEI